MGLDFSHCEARWGYIGFNVFRTKLAAEAGIALHCMEGFAASYGSIFTDEKTTLCQNVKVYDSKIDDKRHPAGFIGYQPVISWDKIKDDIKLLLNHSDCDGYLTPRECKKIAPRLRELVANWLDDDRDKINALMLADGMEKAFKNKEKLKFY